MVGSPYWRQDKRSSWYSSGRSIPDESYINLLEPIVHITTSGRLHGAGQSGHSAAADVLGGHKCLHVCPFWGVPHPPPRCRNPLIPAHYTLQTFQKQDPA